MPSSLSTYHIDHIASSSELFLLFQNSSANDDLPLSVKKMDLSDASSSGTEQFLFKIRTDSGTELLLKADCITSMQQWVQVSQIEPFSLSHEPLSKVP